MKMETSKKLLWLNHVIFYVLITLVIICTFAGIECSNLTTVTSCVAVEVGAATSFYYSMNKKLNFQRSLSTYTMMLRMSCGARWILTKFYRTFQINRR